LREVTELLRRNGPAAQSLFRSGLSIRALLELSDGRQPLTSLTESIPGSPPGSVHRSLKRLVGESLVEEEKGTYRLTNAGTIIVRRMIPLIRSFYDPVLADDGASVLAARYPEYETDMNAILLSGHATTMLCALRDGTLSRDYLRELTGARSTTLRTRLRLLTDRGYIREEPAGYLLTALGEETADQVWMFMRTMDLISRQKRFWNDHAIGMLPDLALDTLFRLSGMEIEHDTPANISANLRTYFQGITRAQWIAGISEWTSPELHEVFSKEVMAGKAVRFLFPPEVIAVMYREPYLENMRFYRHYPNLQIWVPEEPPGFALTVTDSLTVLKLYAQDGVSFTNARLRGFNSKEATGWGLTVFDYFRDQSTRLEDYIGEKSSGFPHQAGTQKENGRQEEP